MAPCHIGLHIQTVECESNWATLSKVKDFIIHMYSVCLSYILERYLKITIVLPGSNKGKQEAHGPHRSPEKAVQINKHIWLNIYNNINKEKQKKTLLTLWEFIFSSFEETWIPFIQEWFVLRLVEIGSLVLEKKIF